MNTMLIQIIGDFLNERKSEYTIDESIIHLAKVHQVQGIVYYQTKIPSLKSAYAYALYHYRKRLMLLTQIDSLFQEAQLPYFLVKGTEISQYYPQPALKTMGDSDITVHLDDKERAANLLLEAGFTQKEGDRNSKSEWHFYKESLLFELHHELIYGSKHTGETENDEYLEYFSNCWDYMEENRLSPNFHLLYLLIHLRKHFMNKGIGIRQFIDLAVYTKAELDWSLLIHELKQLKLYSFAQKVYGLIAQWWGIKTPITGALEDSFYERATEMILSAGVFGNESDDGSNHMINQIRHGKTKTKFIKSWLFPSYENMISCRDYRALQGRQYLLPIFWLYRFVTKFKKYQGAVTYLSIDEKQIKERNHIFEEWGLKIE